MTPVIGQIVQYRLRASDAEQINRRRRHAQRSMDTIRSEAMGYQAHIGNQVAEDELVAMIVTQVWPNSFKPDEPAVNGQALLDGADSLWVTSVAEGTTPGTWQRVPV